MKNYLKLWIYGLMAAGLAAPCLPVLAADPDTPVQKEEQAQKEAAAGTVTVTFDGNGGTFLADGKQVSSVTMSKELQPQETACYIGVPTANPVRDGYEFGGYSTSPDGTGMVFTSSSLVSGDMTVYAIWNKKQEAPGKNKWIQEANGTWRYQLANGDYLRDTMQKIDGEWYLFDSQGIMLTGMHSYEGKTYFFGVPSGARQNGWVYVRTGSTANWFYFTDNGYKTGWLKDGKARYYMNSNGTMRTKWLEENGYWYYLDSSSGAMMASRWATIGDYQYYFTSDGTMKTGWYKDPDDGNWYLFGSTGALAKGWYKDPKDGNWYLLGSDGAMVTGWYTDPDTKKTYLLADNGIMITGWCKDLENGQYYYFTSAGAMVRSSWVYSEGNYYYIKDDGYMATQSWIRSGGNLYYVQKDGTMARDVTLGGYHFDADGICTNPENPDRSAD